MTKRTPSAVNGGGMSEERRKPGRPRKYPVNKHLEETPDLPRIGSLTRKYGAEKMRELRTASLEVDNRKKRFWLKDREAYYQSGTLFPAYGAEALSKDEATEEAFDVCTGLLHYLAEHPKCLTLQEYLVHAGVSKYSFTRMIETNPQFKPIVEQAKTVLETRLIHAGYSRDGWNMSKFLLENAYGYANMRKTEQTVTTTNIQVSKEELSQMSTEALARKLEEQLSRSE